MWIAPGRGERRRLVRMEPGSVNAGPTAQDGRIVNVESVDGPGMDTVG